MRTLTCIAALSAALLMTHSAFAASGGKMKPFRRHNLAAPKLEEEAFKPRPGQVSVLMSLLSRGATANSDPYDTVSTLNPHKGSAI